jgi:hypothetical protein
LERTHARLSLSPRASLRLIEDLRRETSGVEGVVPAVGRAPDLKRELNLSIRNERVVGRDDPVGRRRVLNRAGHIVVVEASPSILGLVSRRGRIPLSASVGRRIVRVGEERELRVVLIGCPEVEVENAGRLQDPCGDTSICPSGGGAAPAQLADIVGGVFEIETLLHYA